MSDCCVGKDAIFADPCQALTDGVLNPTNYARYGLTREIYYLLVAQCGTTGAIVDLTDVAEQILACCDASLLVLIDIEADTTAIDIGIQDLITLVTAGNATRDDILTAVEAILVEAIAINANTDGLEALLATIITVLNTIDSNTDGLEACCAAGNAILTDIELNQEDDDIFGTHTIAIGTQAAPPAAGPYFSWTVVRIDLLGAAATLTADGLPMFGQGDSTGETAQPQHQVPAPVIVPAGGALYAWRTVS